MKLGDEKIELVPKVLGDAIVDQMTGEMEEPEVWMMVTGQAEGAMPNGTRVYKTTYEEGDTFNIGTVGTVVSSIGPLTAEDVPNDPSRIGEYGYFVEYDPIPDIPALTSGHKLALLEGE